MNSSKSSKIYVVAFYVFLLVGWQSLYSFGAIPDYLFPSPFQVAKKLNELLVEGLLWPSIKATLIRMVIGFAVAAIIGLLIGLLMGMSRLVNSCLRSLFLGLQPLPTAGGLLSRLLLFEFKEEAFYFLFIISAMPAVPLARAMASC